MDKNKERVKKLRQYIKDKLRVFSNPQDNRERGILEVLQVLQHLLEV